MIWFLTAQTISLQSAPFTHLSTSPSPPGVGIIPSLVRPEGSFMISLPGDYIHFIFYIIKPHLNLIKLTLIWVSGGL